MSLFQSKSPFQNFGVLGHIDDEDDNTWVKALAKRGIESMLALAKRIGEMMISLFKFAFRILAWPIDFVLDISTHNQDKAAAAQAKVHEVQQAAAAEVNEARFEARAVKAQMGRLVGRTDHSDTVSKLVNAIASGQQITVEELSALPPDWISWLANLTETEARDAAATPSKALIEHLSGRAPLAHLPPVLTADERKALNATYRQTLKDDAKDDDTSAFHP